MTDLPMDTSRELFHFTDGALAYAGYHFHEQSNPLHTHSFVEIAFATDGEGVHHSLAGRQQLQEAVRVQRVDLVVAVRAGVGEGPVGEVEQVPAGVHREVGHSRNDTARIIPKLILCYQRFIPA